VKNGVDFDVAHSMEPFEVMAHTIAFGEFEGGEFDFHAFRWKERR